MEDATTLWPVFLQTGSLQESIIILEQEMVFHKLGLLLVCHRKQRVVGSLEITWEVFRGLHNLLLDLQPLLSVKPGAERITLEISCCSDAHRLDFSGKATRLREQIVKQLLIAHIGLMLVTRGTIVVLIDDRREERTESIVRVRTASIDSDS